MEIARSAKTGGQVWEVVERERKEEVLVGGIMKG